MPEIEITTEQQEYLDELCERLERDVVGPYGHVRPREALQYLIDSHEGELPADATDGEAAVEANADATGDGGTALDAASGDSTPTPAPDAATVDRQPGTAGSANPSTDPAASASGDVDAEESGADETPDADSSDDGGAAASGGGSGGDRLSAMMQLLDTHDDKWREADGDARYEVDLPDGSTETAQTKDDVRAILFKNY